MKGPFQAAMRRFTQVTRPIALRSAGKAGSPTSVIHHVGRRSARTYETPVVAVHRDGSFFIALPYDKRTDWLKNVLASGSAEVVTDGRTFPVDHPEVIAMGEATASFGQKEQRLHRRFKVESALRLHCV